MLRQRKYNNFICSVCIVLSNSLRNPLLLANKFAHSSASQRSLRLQKCCGGVKLNHTSGSQTFFIATSLKNFIELRRTTINWELHLSQHKNQCDIKCDVWTCFFFEINQTLIRLEYYNFFLNSQAQPKNRFNLFVIKICFCGSRGRIFCSSLFDVVKDITVFRTLSKLNNS